MIYLLTIFALFVWPFGQLLAFPIAGTMTVYLLDIALGMLMISLIVFPKTRVRMMADPLFRPLAIFNLVAAFSLLVNMKFLLSGDYIYPLFYFLRLLVYPSIYFAVKQLPPGKIFKPVLISFLIFSLLGLLQYLFFPDMRYLRELGFDDHYFRLIGSLYDPNLTGAILAGVSLLLISIGNIWVALPVIVLLALTFSRASYLCFILGLIYLLLRKKNYSLLAILGFLAITIWLIPKPFGEGVNLLRTFSVFSRFDSWNEGWQLFLQRPIIGWGFNTLRNLTGTRFQIDNSYLFIAATTGVIGLLSYFNLIKQALTGLALPSLIFTITLLLHAFFNNSLFYIWINFAFWLILALPFKGYKPK